MMKDMLDIMNPKQRFVMTGKYYHERPTNTEVQSEEFTYSYVEPSSKSWRSLFGNIQAIAGQAAIKTDEQLPFKAGQGIVVLQDGTAYQIEAKLTDWQSAEQQAFRVLPVPVSVEYLLRLVEIEELWGVQ